MEHLLYAQLAEQLIDQIRLGLYPAGERLPSVRKLAERERVSIATVNAAYGLLIDRGWAEARPKAGYFVKHHAERCLKPLQTLGRKPRPRAVTTSELAMEVQRGSSCAQGHSFCAAVPDLNFAIHKAIPKSFARLARCDYSHPTGYDEPEGWLELRRQIARRAVDAGLALSPDDIITTAGCQNAIALALRAITKPGDIVAVESPCYFGLMQMLESFELRVLEIPSDLQHGININALTEALEKWPVKVLLTIASFSNPLGCCIPDSHKAEIMALMQRHDVAVIEDDIYGELQFSGNRPKALKAFDSDGRVLWCASVSKTLDPQLRVGWIAPGRYFEAMLQQKYIYGISQPIMAQKVTADIMAQGLYDRHLRQAREAYRQRALRLADLMNDCFPDYTRASQPQGGLVTWVELPKGFNATQLYQRCLDEHIRIAPGELFSVSGQYQHCFRINFAKPWTAPREQSIARIGEHIKGLHG